MPGREPFPEAGLPSPGPLRRAGRWSPPPCAGQEATWGPGPGSGPRAAVAAFRPALQGARGKRLGSEPPPPDYPVRRCRSPRLTPLGCVCSGGGSVCSGLGETCSWTASSRVSWDPAPRVGTTPRLTPVPQLRLPSPGLFRGVCLGVSGPKPAPPAPTLSSAPWPLPSPPWCFGAHVSLRLCLDLSVRLSPHSAPCSPSPQD